MACQNVLGAQHIRFEQFNSDSLAVILYLPKLKPIVEVQVIEQFHGHSPISSQCSHFISPENTRESLVLVRGNKMRTLARTD